MKKTLLLFLVLLFVSTAWGQQPFGGCWHPEYVKNWTPEADPDAKFNRSTVPLQPRFTGTIKANATQFPEGQVTACLTMNPMCSQTPSQGANNFIGYNPTYWQYMDVLVWWGGSAGEGIIVPPSAPVTDAAHQSGVKVLGQVFFPPGTFGGQAKWVTEMLEKKDGVYPLAKKMYEIAKYYGFDGWFLNEEITFSQYIVDWTAWVKYYNECAAAGGDSHMEIQWYDCGTTIGNKAEMLKLHNASYFLNYGSPSASNIESQMSQIQGYGFTKEEAMRKLYFGIECAQGGFTGNGSSFRNLYTQTGHNGSIDLFNPEEGIWKKVVEKQLGTPDASGSVAYGKMNTVFANESRFWTNAQADVTNVSGWTGASWPGFANAIQERSVITSKPFVTSFSAGLGKHRFVNGAIKGTQDWYHRGMQDIMPTWRWWITNKKINIALNWDDAYNKGTSLKITGAIDAGAEQLTRLYKTQLPIATGDQFRLVYKTAFANTIEVKLATTTDGDEFAAFPVVETSSSNGWSVCDIDLSSLAGKTVSVIALSFKSAEAITSYEASLGELAVLPAGYSSSTPAVLNLTVQNALKADGGDIRVIWDAPESDNIHHYNVYLERGGVSTLVGQTRNEAFYIPKFVRNGQQETAVKVLVSSVSATGVEGSLTEVTSSFPAMDKPEVRLKASKTLLAIDEEITLTAFATNFPTGYEWVLPTGATLVSQEDNRAVVKFGANGKYTIGVKVSNAEGATEYSISDYIEVATGITLANVAAKKKIHSESGYLGSEHTGWLIDGVKIPGSTSNKWCIGGAKEHWVVIDLTKVHKIYKFEWYDCGHKENASDNIKNYKIFLSEDALTWSEVLNETKRPENTKTDYIKPTKARYVKFMPYDEEMPITIRVWEFEVYGTEGAVTLAQPSNVDKFLGEVVHHELSYGLGGEDKAANFATSVTVANPAIASITNVEINEQAQTLSYDVTPLAPGNTTASVEVINGEWSAKNSFTIQSKMNWSATTNMTAFMGVSTPVELSFSLGGALPTEDFAFTVVSSNPQIASVSDVAVDHMAGTLSFNVKASQPGNATMTLTLTQAGWSVEQTFEVTSVVHLSQPEDITAYMGVVTSVEMTFGLADDPKTPEYGIVVTSADPTIAAIENLLFDDSTSLINFDVKTLNPGTTKVKVRFTNSDWSKEVEFTVISLVNISQPEDITTNITTITPVAMTFGLGGQEPADNFAFTATSSNTTVATITDLVVDAATGNATFKVNALKDGKIVVTVVLTNGAWSKTITFNVKSIDPDMTNMALGIVATKEDSGQYDQSTNIASITDEDENTYWLSGWSNAGDFKVFLQLDQPAEISKFRVLLKPSVGNFRNPKYIRIYMGMDEASAVEVVNRSTNLAIKDFTFELPNAAIGSYIRFESAGSSSYGVGICEIQALGKIATDIPEPEVELFTPIAISGYNADLIAESKPSAASTSTAMDDQGWVFFGEDVQAQGSIPATGLITSSSNKNYQMASYAGNNTLLKKDGTEGVLTLATAAPMKGYMLLGTSANGNSDVQVTTVYTDGTTDVANTSFGDWYSDSASGSAVYGLSRIVRDAVDDYEADAIDNRYKFRMFESRVAANPDKIVESIKIKRTSSAGYPMVFAVTKITKDLGTGVEDATLDNVSIYPNPLNRGQRLNITLEEEAQVRVVTIQGSVVLLTDLTAGSNSLNLDQLASGVYMVCVSSGESVRMTKIVIR